MTYLYQESHVNISQKKVVGEHAAIKYYVYEERTVTQKYLNYET